MRYVQGLLLVALAFYAIDAQSVTYYWKGGNSWADYGTLSNWSTESATGADATALPGADDSLATQTCYFDLGGKTWEIGTTSPGSAHSYQFTNGVFRILKYSEPKGRSTHVYNGATVVCSSGGMGLGWWDAAPLDEYVHFGGVLDYSAANQINAHNWNLFISSGGTAKLCRKWVDGLNRTHTINNSGTLDLSMGFYASQNSSGVKWNFTQNAGALILGGPFSNQGYANELNLSLNGGSVVLKEGASFFATSAVIGENKTVAFECDFDFDMASSIEFMTGANLVKTGDGTLVMDALPDVLTLQGGGVRTSSAVPAVVFAGGELELVAETKSISCISAVSAEEGAKAKISLRDLYLLLPGEYTIVAVGNTLTDADYEFEFDPSVIAEASVKDDGSVVLTVSGLAEDLNPLVWRPENLSQEWDYSTASWMQGEERLVFVDGTSVVFDGTEANYTEEIYVNGSPNVKSITFGGDRDYLLSGERIDTCYVVKQGTGKLAIDGNGFSGKDISLIGGELQLQPGAKEFVKDGVSLVVPEKSAVSISTDKSRGRNTMSHLFRFEYISGSADWDTRTEYTTKLSVDSISDFINVASPKAPDGVSLSGKSVFVSGYFYVSEEEVGDWSFKGIYDDGIVLWVDGAQLFKTADWQDTKTASVNLDAGWHEFKIRAYDGSGGWGMANCLQAKTPIADDYVNFNEKNFQMNWYGSAMDSNKPLDGVIVDLSVGANSTLTICSAGYVVRNLELADDAMIAIDPHSVPANKTFVSAKDADTLSILKAHIQYALGDIGKVVETDDGLAWEMESVFESDSVTDLMDKNGWKIGILPDSSEDVTISGESTKAVMGETTTAFNSISLADGASLTVNAEREIPKISLAAGTSLNVAHAGETMMEITIPGFLSKDEIKVGDIDPSVSLADIADITGLIGGANWNAKYKGLPYEKVEVSEDGDSKIVIKFIHFEKPYKKGVLVELRKEDGSLYVKAIKAVYEQDDNFVPGTSVLDLDFSKLPDQGVATSDDTKAYGVRDFSFKYPHRLAGAVSVTAADDFVTAGEGSVIVDVAEGCMLDLSKVNVETGAKLVKTGLGTVFFGNKVPSSVEIAEGVVELLPYVEYDMSGVVVGENAEIKVRINGKSEDAAPLVRDDKILYMAKYTYCGVGSWNEVSNWAGGVLPGADDIVYVHGEGTEFDIDDAQVVMPLKIVAEDGVMIRITESISLSSQIQLAPLSKVLVGDGSKDVSVDIIAGFSASADTKSLPVAIPTVEVAAHATMLVSTEEKFKNIFLKVFGTIKPRDGKKMTFGWAESGETTYFGLFVDGGTLDVTEGKSFASPAAGGTVIVQEPIVVKNAKIPTDWWSVINIGKNNNPDYPFDFVLDNSTLFTGVYDSYIGGAATLFVTNNAWLRNDINSSRSIQIRIVEKGRIVLQNDGNLRFVPSNGFLRIENDEGAPAGLVLAGGRLEPWHQSGSKNSSIHVSQDSYWDLYSARINPFGDDRAWNNEPLADLREVYIEKDSTLIFRFIEKLGNWGVGAQSFLLGNTPISGAGSVVLENSRKDNDLFTVTIRNGANTSTGTAAADDRSMLLFADGANWVGTVVAGNVALTNLTDGASAASVDFAKLDLASDFPLRVWRNEDGSFVSDTLNVGEYLDSGARGGKIVPVAMFDGEFAPKDSFVLGTISKGSALPPVGRGWTAKIVEIEGDEENAQLLLERNSGFSIVIR